MRRAKPINLISKHKTRKYSAKELSKIADKKYPNTSAYVWYSRNDGWWFENTAKEVYLGVDSVGAYLKLIQDEL
jgi:hypothetical protein